MESTSPAPAMAILEPAETTRARPPKAPSLGQPSACIASAPTPADELRTLKAAVTDLQTKRLTALRLYHEEKVRRQQQESRADQLAAQVKSLSQPAPANHAQSTPSPITPTASGKDDSDGNVTSTADADADICEYDAQVPLPDLPKTRVLRFEQVVAEVRQLSLLPPAACSSLTWYSKSMENAFPNHPEAVAVLYPLPPDLCIELDAVKPQELQLEGHTESLSTQITQPMEQTVSTKGDMNALEGDKQSKTDDAANETDTLIDPDEGEDVSLHEKLRYAQHKADDAHEQLQLSQRLITDMKEQLDASTAACKDLIHTINEQEDTINDLS